MIIKCAYCKKTIIDKKRPDNDKDYRKAYKSSEHIIQNAIGGKFESVKICCDRCNYHLERLIDKEFCDIFVPFTSSIPNFRTSRNTAEAPHSGYCFNSQLGEDAIFSAEAIKGRSVRASREIIQRLKDQKVENINSQKNKILNASCELFSDFNLDNDIFKNGLAKIAFSFALFSDIPIEKVSSFINISLSEENGELQNVSFNTQMIPFVALNNFDKSIEFSNLNDDFPPFHNIVLFRYQTQLWCFVNLFDTFQWYVKMSDEFQTDNELECEVINSIFQFVQSRPQDITDKKTDNIKKSLELNDSDLFLLKKIAIYAKQDEITKFYLDSNNGGFTNKYHLICASTNIEHNSLFGLFYPTCIQDVQNNIYSDMHVIIREYTVRKFQRLSYYSNLSKPTLSPEFFSSLSESDLTKFNSLLKQSCVSKRVSKQIDLNILFPETTSMPLDENEIKDIIYSNATALKLKYDGNVHISFIDRTLGPSTLDSLINKIANEWIDE